MEGFPADIGSWGVVRIFQEGGRLLSKHFGVFLPAILLCIFPASLIKVLYTQFLFALQFYAPDVESRSLLTTISFSIVSAMPQFFILLGVVMLIRVLTNEVYATDCKAGPGHTGVLIDRVKLASFGRDVETENPVLRTLTTEHSRYERLRETSKGKKLKACAVGLACSTIYSIVSSGGLAFTPEAVAEMGLPPGTIFLFTLLITLLSTATTAYLILVNLVMFIWICSPKTLILQ